MSENNNDGGFTGFNTIVKTIASVAKEAHKKIDPKCLHLSLEELIKQNELADECLEGLSKLLGLDGKESLRNLVIDTQQSDLPQEALDQLRKNLDTQLVADYLQKYSDVWKPLHNTISPVNGFINACGKGICAFDDSIESMFALFAHKVVPKLAEDGCKKFAHGAGPFSVVLGSVFIVVKVASASNELEKKKQAVRGSWELGLSTLGGACGSLVPIPVVGTMAGSFVGSLLGGSIATKIFGC